MGANSFFSKFASVDPVTQILDLPSAHKYAQAQSQRDAGATDTNGGPYTGIDPTLAGANAGYKPGGPGAPVGWTPTQPTPGNSLFGFAQHASNLAGNLSPYTATMPGFVKTAAGVAPNSMSTTNPYVQQSTTQNPYVLAAGNAVQNNRGGLYG